jgi:SpoIID/LytB domain protein
MPPSWNLEALKAQAIAARSYALRGLRNGGWYDLYVDTRSQVYGGVGAEEETSDAAVAATADMVARVGGPAGEVAQTFFFSTSGGRTASNEDVWAGTPYSYLRSVPSPYESASSYWNWTGKNLKRYTPAQLGNALGVRAVRSASLTLHPSGYADDLVLRTARGATTVSAGTVQYRLGLPSTWFRLQPLTLVSPFVAREGGIMTLTGTIPTTGATSLRIVRPGQPMRTVPLVKRDAKGSWRVRMRTQGNVTVTLVRSGILGPRAVIASSATTLGKTRLRAQRKAAAQRRAAARR